MSGASSISQPGWVWHNAEEGLPGTLRRLSSDDTARLVKRNGVRSVWKLGDYYVKYNHPSGKMDRIRFSMRAKAMSEHKSIKALQSAGIRTVEPCGWAKLGSRSLLVTRELSGFSNAHSYWFGGAFQSQDKKRKFLSSLAAFTKELVSRKIRHPDLHLGNLLVDATTFDFAIVDAYGVSCRKSLSPRDVFGLFRIVSSVKGEIGDREAKDFLLDCGAAASDQEADMLWTRIMQADVPELAKKWRKIKAGIYSDGKSCARHELDGRVVIVRKDILGRELALPGELSDGASFSRTEERLENAERKWEDSFLLELNRIPSALPLAIEIKKGKSAIASAALFWRKRRDEAPGIVLSRHELIKRCSIFRLPRRLTEQVVSR